MWNLLTLVAMVSPGPQVVQEDACWSVTWKFPRRYHEVGIKIEGEVSNSAVPSLVGSGVGFRGHDRPVMSRLSIPQGLARARCVLFQSYGKDTCIEEASLRSDGLTVTLRIFHKHHIYGRWEPLLGSRHAVLLLDGERQEYDLPQMQYCRRVRHSAPPRQSEDIILVATTGDDEVDREYFHNFEERKSRPGSSITLRFQYLAPFDDRRLVLQLTQLEEFEEEFKESGSFRTAEYSFIELIPSTQWKEFRTTVRLGDRSSSLIPTLFLKSVGPGVPASAYVRDIWIQGSDDLESSP